MHITLKDYKKDCISLIEKSEFAKMKIKKAPIFATEIFKKISNTYLRYVKDIFIPNKNAKTNEMI